MWGADNASFVKQFFAWIDAHRRVKMILYNQGTFPSAPFRLKSFPKAKAEVRKALRNPRFLDSVDS